MGYSIISKVQSKYPSIQESVNGMAFIQKVSEFYEAVLKVNNSKAGLMFLKSIALGLDVDWSMMVEYIYYLVKEKMPSLYKDYESSLDYNYICLNIGGVFGKLLNSESDSVYANKYLFDAVVANAEADAEEWLQPYILEKYGWDSVMRDLVIMYNQYLLESSHIAEKEDYDYIKRTIVAINKNAKKDESLVVSDAIKNALTDDEYSALYDWMESDDKTAHKLHLKVVDGVIYSDKEEVKVVVMAEPKKEEPLEDVTPAIEKKEEMEESIDVPMSTMDVPSKKAITKEDIKDEDNDAVLVYCEEDNTTQRFNSPKEASEVLHIELKYIHKRLNGDGKKLGKGKGAKHYTIKYVVPHLKNGKVLQIDPKTNEVVATFKRVVDAEREYGYKPTKLNGVLKTVSKLCDGYMWMYEKEYNEKYPSKEYDMVA